LFDRLANEIARFGRRLALIQIARHEAPNAKPMAELLLL
jgi:hypothetical protein